MLGPLQHCSEIAEAEAAASVNQKKWLVMHMHVQLKLDKLRGPQNPWLTVGPGSIVQKKTCAPDSLS
jgi:hypothetical protein